MSRYEKEWPCCGDTTITNSWEPESCPFCSAPRSSPPVLAVEEGRDAWQPIETAPKDGSEFLAVWQRQGDVMHVVRWNALHKFWQSKGEPIAGFATNATAWMPIKPPSPSPTVGEDA